MGVSSSTVLCDKGDGNQEHKTGNVSTKISSIFSEISIHGINIRLSVRPSVRLSVCHNTEANKISSWIRG